MRMTASALMGSSIDEVLTLRSIGRPCREVVNPFPKIC
jgi:hypothetical protein